MESFTEDTLYNITSYLTSQDILNLALTCKHFGGKPGGTAEVSSTKKRKTKRRRKTDTTNNDESSSEREWSLMEEMAKRRVDAIKKNVNWQEKWKGTDVYKLTRRTSNESWIRVDNYIQKMSSELIFSRFIGNSFGYVKKNPSHVQMRRYTDDMCLSNSIAICQDIMTEGRQYVEYTVTRDGSFSPGIIYPIQNCHEAQLFKCIHIYDPGSDAYRPTNWGRSWFQIMGRHTLVCDGQGWNASHPKQQFHMHTLYRIQKKGTVMGVLLDFNKDTMQIYVNGRCAETYNGRYSGGQYSWGVLLDSSSFGGAVKIERKPPPVEVEVISPLV